MVLFPDAVFSQRSGRIQFLIRIFIPKDPFPFQLKTVGDVRKKLGNGNVGRRIHGVQFACCRMHM
jgi:hypothetical protein